MGMCGGQINTENILIKVKALALTMFLGVLGKHKQHL